MHALADSVAHPQQVMHLLPLLQLSLEDTLLIKKDILRRCMRALLPPRGSDLPGGLTRHEEVVLRRIRLGVTLTPAVRATWTSSLADPSSTCPYCPAPIAAATLEHLLGTCPGLQSTRA